MGERKGVAKCGHAETNATLKKHKISAKAIQDS
jgi:hypothetical protein